jgi:hypothetical protein
METIMFIFAGTFQFQILEGFAALFARIRFSYVFRAHRN